MARPCVCRSDQAILESQHFQQLIDALLERGYEVLGPTIRDQAIVYDRIKTVTDLPIGYTDEQDGASID